MGSFAELAAKKAAPAAAKVAAASTPAPVPAPARAVIPKTQGAAPAKPAPAKPAAPISKKTTPTTPAVTVSAPTPEPTASLVAEPTSLRQASMTSWLMEQPAQVPQPGIEEYKERLAKVAELRANAPDASAGFGLGALFSLPESDWVGGYRRSVTPSAGVSRQTAPESVSLRARTGRIVKPSNDALQNVLKFKTEAEEQGMRYKAARDAIGQLERMTPKLEARKDAQAPAARAQLAQMMRAQQQDLTESLASLKEFGFDESEVAQKFK